MKLKYKCHKEQLWLTRQMKLKYKLICHNQMKLNKRRITTPTDLVKATTPEVGIGTRGK
jgi:hypothetical protein